MHQVAHRHVKKFPFEHSTGTKVRVMLLLTNALDSEILSAAITQRGNIDVLVSTSDVDYGLSRCDRLLPDILILDPKISCDAVFRATEAVRLRKFRHLLLLDDRLREGRFCSILKMPAVSYLTRQAGLSTLLAGILQIATNGERSFDPALQKRLRRTQNGFRLEPVAGQPSIALLTSREMQVMKLLAKGCSVRMCAEQLSLAESTIDNHKSRLMKKLAVHKTVELTHLAISEGLIVV